MDTVIPSTNATSASNLFRLGAALGDSSYTKLAKETVNAFEIEMLQHHFLFVGLLTGVVTARLGGRYYFLNENEASSASTRAFLAKHYATARSEARTVVRVNDASWLLERNPSLKTLPTGVSVLREGEFHALA